MVDVDIGFALVAILSSLFGSIVQFWVSVYKEEAELAGGILDLIAQEMKEISQDLKETGMEMRRKIFRNYIKTKRKVLRKKYLDKWLVTLFFGLIAGVFYLLIGQVELHLGYFVAAAFNGYAGESFVMKVLEKETTDISWNETEIKQFRNNFLKSNKEEMEKEV